MTEDYLNELEQFWDAFAEEYETIQQESRFPIAEELKQFLLQQEILPAHSFLDLAGGSGRYLAELQDAVEHYTLVDISNEMLEIARTKQKNSKIDFIHQDQNSFFKTNSQSYDVAFTAMNPELVTQEDLLNFSRKSHSWCLILRLVQQSDSLFSPYEAVEEEVDLMKNYQIALKEAGIPFEMQDFNFSAREEITREFFEAYFAEEFSPQQARELAAEVFGSNKTLMNLQNVTYRLIYYRV